MKEGTNPYAMTPEPNLTALDSFARCGALLDFIEDNIILRDGENTQQWAERNRLVGQTFWRLAAQYWSIMDSIDHASMAYVFGQYLDDWTIEALSSAQRKMYLRLPRRKPITIYRGQGEGQDVGLAWTTRRSVAEWFARHGIRGSGNDRPILLKSEVWRDEVALCTNDREEREVVLLSVPAEYEIFRLY